MRLDSKCFNKVQFHSRSAASSSINFHRLKNCEPYFCVHCETWHIGRVDLIAKWKEDIKHR